MATISNTRFKPSSSHKYIKKEPDGHDGWKYTYPDDKYGGINNAMTKASGSQKASKQGLAKAMNKNVQNGGGREEAQAKGAKINANTAKRMAGGYSPGLYSPLNSRILSTQTYKAFRKVDQNRNARNNGGGREAAQKKGSKINKKSKLQIAMLRGAKKLRSM